MRNNKLVAQNRWKNARAADESKIANGAKVEFAALCGFLSGDGSVKKRTINGSTRYDIRFFPDDEELLRTFIIFMATKYGKTPHVESKEKFFHVQITSTVIGMDLLQRTTFGIFTWKVPEFVTLDEKVAWLRAFFSAEGYVGERTIRLQTVHKSGMRQVSDLLFELSIEHKTYMHQPKNSHHSKVFIVIIQKREARERYASLVGFWHAKKTARLRAALLKTALQSSR